MTYNTVGPFQVVSFNSKQTDASHRVKDERPTVISIETFRQSKKMKLQHGDRITKANEIYNSPKQVVINTSIPIQNRHRIEDTSSMGKNPLLCHEHWTKNGNYIRGADPKPTQSFAIGVSFHGKENIKHVPPPVYATNPSSCGRPYHGAYVSYPPAPAMMNNSSKCTMRDDVSNSRRSNDDSFLRKTNLKHFVPGSTVVMNEKQIQRKSCSPNTVLDYGVNNAHSHQHQFSLRHQNSHSVPRGQADRSYVIDSSFNYLCQPSYWKEENCNIPPSPYIRRPIQPTTSTIHVKETNKRQNIPIKKRKILPDVSPKKETGLLDLLCSVSVNFGSMIEVGCKCSKTQCLKLYCDCFQAGKVCHPSCSCRDCLNTKNESGPLGKRTEAINEILKRRPDAFEKREKKMHNGCACKNSK